MSPLMNEQQFTATLNAIYNGQVTCLENFTTSKANLRFVCNECHTRFYANSLKLIGTDQGQHHKCFHDFECHGVRRQIKYTLKYSLLKIAKVQAEYIRLNDIYLVADSLQMRSYDVYYIVHHFSENLIFDK